MKSKIVVDTNVFIGSLIGKKGPNRKLIQKCLNSEFQPLMGNALFVEYESVIHRDDIQSKCPLSKQEISEFLSAFMSVCQWVTIYYLWRPNLRDEADNHLIELAVAGNAKFVVTNNAKDFRNTQLLFPDLSIIKPENIIDIES
jgi:uncharacterized protein